MKYLTQIGSARPPFQKHKPHLKSLMSVGFYVRAFMSYSQNNLQRQLRIFLKQVLDSYKPSCLPISLTLEQTPCSVAGYSVCQGFAGADSFLSSATLTARASIINFLYQILTFYQRMKKALAILPPRLFLLSFTRYICCLPVALFDQDKIKHTHIL